MNRCKCADHVDPAQTTHAIDKRTDMRMVKRPNLWRRTVVVASLVSASGRVSGGIR